MLLPKKQIIPQGLQIVLGMAIAIAVAIGATVILSRQDAPADGQMQAAALQARAVSECKSELKRQAHDPGSVNWVEEQSWPTMLVSDGQWRSVMRYRAKNGFGAVRMQESDCTVRYDSRSKGWQVERLAQN